MRASAKNPVRRDAGLPAIAIFGGDRAFDREIEIGVLEDDQWRIAAELHRAFYDVVRRLPQQQPADLGRTGEGELSHQRVLRHFGADRGRIERGDDIHHAGGNSGAFREIGEGEGGVGRLLGGFDHHRAAGAERCADFAREHCGGKVPRRDRGADADRLFQRELAPVA